MFKLYFPDLILLTVFEYIVQFKHIHHFTAVVDLVKLFFLFEKSKYNLLISNVPDNLIIKYTYMFCMLYCSIERLIDIIFYILKNRAGRYVYE